MLFKNVLKPEDLTVLRATFDEHCQKFGITSKEGRDSVAASLIVHYQNGISDPQQLKNALDHEEQYPGGHTAKAVPIV